MDWADLLFPQLLLIFRLSSLIFCRPSHSCMKQQPPVSSLQWFGWTDRGKVRPHNEDSFLGLQFDANEVHRLGKMGEGSTAHNDFAFAVSDGMGGALAGEFASRIAVEKITTLLPRSYKLSALGLNADIDDVLEELFDQIHKALVYVGNSYEEDRKSVV